MAKPYKDPVCGMQIDPEHAAARSVYQGVTYHFCSTVCKQLFDREPEDYLDPRQELPQPTGQS
jgi:Cu+-exporting ATPase